MIAVIDRLPDELKTRLSPLMGAILLTLALLFLLTLANRGPVERAPQADKGQVVMQSINVPDPTTEVSSATKSPNLSSLIPKEAPAVIAELKVEPQRLDIDIEVSQMLQMRYAYDDLNAPARMGATFGISTLVDVDDPVQNVVIPPNLFPESLIERGIYEGQVNLTILVDERGRATVKRILAATHPELVDPVVKSVNRAVYTVPIRNGKPTKVLITRAVKFKAREDRIFLHKLLK
jgi:hypothetical protein